MPLVAASQRGKQSPRPARLSAGLASLVAVSSFSAGSRRSCRAQSLVQRRLACLASPWQASARRQGREALRGGRSPSQIARAVVSFNGPYDAFVFRKFLRAVSPRRSSSFRCPRHRFQTACLNLQLRRHTARSQRAYRYATNTTMRLFAPAEDGTTSKHSFCVTLRDPFGDSEIRSQPSVFAA